MGNFLIHRWGEIFTQGVLGKEIARARNTTGVFRGFAGIPCFPYQRREIP